MGVSGASIKWLASCISYFFSIGLLDFAACYKLLPHVLVTMRTSSSI